MSPKYNINGQLNIVLLNPEIPPNTGNVGRTCIGVGAALHLIEPLGFSLDDKYLKRAGLDYWPQIDLRRHLSWEFFLNSLEPSANLYFFSTHGEKTFWDVRFEKPCYLIFGAESHGFPKEFYMRYKEKLVRIPVLESIRSLNLATAVGAATIEAVRQWTVSPIRPI
jgi:tRNA (cytidine/uridine-2'-O-)-methyltransferase